MLIQSFLFLRKEGYFLKPDYLGKLQIGQLTLANPLLLAPMAGISDLPFRLLAREQGCALAFTEMISAEGLIRHPQKSKRFLQSCPADKPLGVQLFGSRPEAMAAAAQIIAAWGADLLDINMGCPVNKVVKLGAGAALLKDLALAKRIIRAVRSVISIPLTIKIRLGWDEKDKNYLQVAQMAEEEGVDGLTIHGRTRSQGYGVRADWKAIGEAQRRVRIPVIGNGDLTTPQSILNFFKETGCAGAMIGRGALGNPWIFGKTLSLAETGKIAEPSWEDKIKVVERHLEMLINWRGEEQGVKEFRKHLIWYTKGWPGNNSFRAEVAKGCTKLEVLEKVHKYFRKVQAASIYS